MSVIQFPKQNCPDQKLWNEFLALKNIALKTGDLSDALNMRIALNAFLHATNSNQEGALK